MSQFISLITQDAALLPCELDRLREKVLVPADELVGVGAWHEGQVVQRQYGVGGTREAMWDVSHSSSVMMAVTKPKAAEHVGNTSQPFRFRQWQFAVSGQIEQEREVKERLHEELPEFLSSMLHHSSWEEVLFARFLAELRTHHRLDEPSRDPSITAMHLNRCADALEQISCALHQIKRPSVAMAASNGQCLIVARRGETPVYYSLWEGRAECARHHLSTGANEAVPLVRDHRRRRTLVATSFVPVDGGTGWVLLPDRSVLSVDRRMTLVIR